jgi:hypothetical protein
MTLATISTADTSRNLWELKFLCRFPELQTRSIEHIKFFGTPTTNDSAIDKELAQQWITSYITIDEMVEHFKKGVPIKVVSYEDVKKIYDYISQHLHAWKSQLSNGLNVGDAPISDLVDLDRFANVVYDHAKFQFTREMADSILAKSMAGIVKYNRTNFFKPEIKVKTDENITRINAEEEPEDLYPKRESLSDLFKDRQITTRKWSQ